MNEFRYLMTEKSLSMADGKPQEKQRLKIDKHIQIRVGILCAKELSIL